MKVRTVQGEDAAQEMHCFVDAAEDEHPDESVWEVDEGQQQEDDDRRPRHATPVKQRQYGRP